MSEIVIYCPECGTEYREGSTMCADCDVPLVRSLDTDVAAEGLVPLTRQHSFEFIAELLDQLEKAEVPYVVEAGTALALLDSKTAPLTAPQPWEARVWVAPSFQAKAAEILDNLAKAWKAERESQQLGRRFFSPDSGPFPGV